MEGGCERLFLLKIRKTLRRINDLPKSKELSVSGRVRTQLRRNRDFFLPYLWAILGLLLKVLGVRREERARVPGGVQKSSGRLSGVRWGPGKLVDLLPLPYSSLTPFTWKAPGPYLQTHMNTVNEKASGPELATSSLRNTGHAPSCLLNVQWKKKKELPFKPLMGYKSSALFWFLDMLNSPSNIQLDLNTFYFTDP